MGNCSEADPRQTTVEVLHCCPCWHNGLQVAGRMRSWMVVLSVVFIASLERLQFTRAEVPDVTRWNLACWFGECCNKEWIIHDLKGLRRTLRSDVFGQHLVDEIIFTAIAGHLTFPSVKPLVLSFHGRPGTGKRYVSKIISEYLFRRGIHSKFVHFKSATKDFFRKDELASYKLELKTLVEAETWRCPYSLFILDEIDWFPPGLLDSLQTHLDTQGQIDGVDYTKNIFIFLSNTGQSSITKKLVEVGLNRTALNTTEMEALLRDAVFEEEGRGFYRSHLITKQVVSHYVPFLPLERKHVRQCIKKEMEDRMLTSKWSSLSSRDIQEIEDEAISYLDFTSINESEVFATKGCKNVGEKLNIAMVKKDIDMYQEEL